MITFRWLFVAALIAFVCAVTPAAEKNSRKAYSGVIVTDASNGRVLFEEDPDVQNPPASMAKLMTFAVLSDKLASGAITLKTPVSITVEDSKMGGTQVYLDARETFPVDELVYAMMIQSANDAAHALARQAAGSIEAFVELMNAKAREIGMTHTTFRTPHGLPPKSRRIADGDLSTPRDYALLCRYLLTKTDVLRYSSVHDRDFGVERKQGPQHMINHNKLLGKVAGVDGLKTGYTEGAGYCLSATAERNGRRVIIVIMGSFGPNGQIDRGRARDLKAVELIERGFAAQPGEFSAAKASGGPAVHQTAPEDFPTVTTQKLAPTGEQSSTAPAAVPTFRIIPPSKKP